MLTKQEREQAQEILDMMKGYILKFNGTFTTYHKQQVEKLLDYFTEKDETKTSS